MKKQKETPPNTAKPEKGKPRKKQEKYTELHKNVSLYGIPEMEAIKDLLKAPPPPKEQPAPEKDTPDTE